MGIRKHTAEVGPSAPALARAVDRLLAADRMFNSARMPMAQTAEVLPEFAWPDFPWCAFTSKQEAHKAALVFHQVRGFLPFQGAADVPTRTFHPRPDALSTRKYDPRLDYGYRAPQPTFTIGARALYYKALGLWYCFGQGAEHDMLALGLTLPSPNLERVMHEAEYSCLCNLGPKYLALGWRLAIAAKLGSTGALDEAVAWIVDAAMDCGSTRGQAVTSMRFAFAQRGERNLHDTRTGRGLQHGDDAFRATRDAAIVADVDARLASWPGPRRGRKEAIYRELAANYGFAWTTIRDTYLCARRRAK